MDIVKFAAIFFIGFSLLFGSKGILAKAQPKEDNNAIVTVDNIESAETKDAEMINTEIRVNITETVEKPQKIELSIQ